MSTYARDGRLFRESMTAERVQLQGGRVELRAPAVGLWRGAPAPGTLVTPGDPLGELEILGRLVQLRAPAGAAGVVVVLPEGPRLARIAVEWGGRLVVLDPEAAGGVVHDARSAEEARAFEGLVLRSPSSGRFYARPAPDQPPFVVAGDEVCVGQTVAILEVMKTFNRIQYGGEGMPERARVKRVAPEDESDLEAGDVILELA